jgi:hypothetical protein
MSIRETCKLRGLNFYDYALDYLSAVKARLEREDGEQRTCVLTPAGYTRNFACAESAARLSVRHAWMREITTSS